MGSGEVGRRTPWQSVQRMRGRQRRSSCSLRRRSAARRCGGTPWDPSPAKYFLQQSTSGYLRAVTLARKSSQRVPKHSGGTIHDVGLRVADVERRTRFKRMQILAVRVGLAYLVRLRAYPSDICATTVIAISRTGGSHHRRRQHRRLHPAAVGSCCRC